MTAENQQVCKIFTGELLARALRDSGYKNTAYAVAELIDNAIQANADNVEVLYFEKNVRVHDRELRRLAQIAVLDNGHGMDTNVLRLSLMFGNGTRLEDRTGIGRFGMGLPNASFSQAKRVEVWSWINGPTNALMTYIDIDEIMNNKIDEVPPPVRAALPQEIIDLTQHQLKDSGTLVLWSKLDDERLTWKTAKSTLQYTEELIGRIHRKFLAQGKLIIRLAAFNSLGQPIIDTNAKPNDPLYLTQNTNTPLPFDKTPMFDPWGEEIITVNWKGENSQVIIRTSFAKPETVTIASAVDRGSTPYGKHAARNLGVSLMRAGRELSLDPSWANSYDPVERWWGCEIEFSPHLDEVFGVTINKQAATLWGEFAQLDFSVLAEDGETSSAQISARLKSEGDPRGILLELSEIIKQQLRLIRKQLTNQTKGRRTKDSRHEDAPLADEVASDKFRDRAAERPAPQDSEVFDEAARQQLVDDLVKNKHYPQDVAEDIATAVWKRDLKVNFIEADFDGFAFFKIEEKPGGVAQVIINSQHLFFDKLYRILQERTDNDDDSNAEIKEAKLALQLLFAAWARYEREATEKERNNLRIVREDWGRMVSFFLEEEE